MMNHNCLFPADVATYEPAGDICMESFWWDAEKIFDENRKTKESLNLPSKNRKVVKASRQPAFEFRSA